MTNETSLAQKAIECALNGQWLQAIEINKQILQTLPENIPALLRLAKAYINTNQIAKAKKEYRKVLKIDKYNPIAKRNLSRLQKIKQSRLAKNCSSLTPIFLEEPGKTKSVNLIRVTDEENLAALEVGEAVKLVYHPRSISVIKDGQYLGRLPDDLAFRLLMLVKRGNQYCAFIRSVCQNKLQIFIKEVKKSKRNLQISSFPIRNKNEDYHSFYPSEAIEE